MTTAIINKEQTIIGQHKKIAYCCVFKGGSQALVA